MIGATEDAIVKRIRDLVGSEIATVETLPAALDLDELKRRRRPSPAIYVAFLGGAPREENELVIDAEFGVFFLTQGASEIRRRRGDETRSTDAGSLRTGGAYSLMQAVAPYLHGFVAPNGSLSCTGMHNLFADELDAEGVSLYSASFRVPVQIERILPADLADFLKLHADWIFPGPLHAVPPAGTALPLQTPDATDVVATDAPGMLDFRRPDNSGLLGALF
jgi:phage gp37-like protein